ncbi:hypothetical protein, partial [Thiolapillus sp.]|uniref:hypothetical protein n=1 Tax=Thiolapillus sp. TaxID=2017437 RepID=UPI003AF56B2B
IVVILFMVFSRTLDRNAGSPSWRTATPICRGEETISSKSTHQRDNHYCPGRPASVPLRHTFVNSALATQHSLK